MDRQVRRHEIDPPEAVTSFGLVDVSSPLVMPAATRIRRSPVAGKVSTTPSPSSVAEPTKIRRSTALSNGEVIRRKSLVQANLATGLTASAETRTTVGSPADGGGIAGTVFDGAAIAKQADKAAAIKAGAVAAGAIGERVDTWGRKDEVGGKAKGKEWQPPRMFTRSPGPFGSDAVATLDPFFHRVAVPYSVGVTDHTLQLIYQHGSAFQGYVSSVTDTSSKSAPTGANMYHGKSNKAKTKNPYPDEHAKTGAANILALTEGTGEESIDAYTKLTGEGARWQCVRDNAAKLSNDSYFYCQHPSAKDSVMTVRFDELWVAWASHFGKKYNIPNAEVILQLTKRGLGVKEAKATMGARDVNLEA